VKRIGILSDTHSYIDDRIIHHFQGCDEIWHAGDIGDMSVAEPLRQMAILRAVHGNIDGGEVRREFPETLTFTVEGLTIYMIHIAGRPGKYPARVKSDLHIAKAGMLVCGHSHICLVHKNPTTGFIHINPGAAGKHGFHKMRTMIRFSISDGKAENLELIELGLRGV
jgi:putative phosphoesterase